MSKRARVYRFTPQDLADWPKCPPPRIEPMPYEDDPLAAARGLVIGALLGTAFWAILALILIPAWMWGLL